MSTNQVETKLKEIFRKLEDVVNDVYELFKTYDYGSIWCCYYDLLKSRRYSKEVFEKALRIASNIEEQEYGEYCVNSHAIRLLIALLTHVVSHRDLLDAMLIDRELVLACTAALYRLIRDLPLPVDFVHLISETLKNLERIFEFQSILVKSIIEEKKKKGKR